MNRVTQLFKLVSIAILVAASTRVTADDARVAADDASVFAAKDPVFTPGVLERGTPTTWTFRSRTDNGRATLQVDAEGINDGAVPDAYAQVLVRAQDEIRDRNNKVLSSNNMWGALRVQSRSFGYTTDPKIGHCLESQCPEHLELYSLRNLRLTAGTGDASAATAGYLDLVTSAKPRLVIAPRGEISLPLLKAPAGQRRFVCVDDRGVLVSQRTPCR